MRFLKDLWEEAKLEVALFEGRRPLTGALLWAAVICYVWLATEHYRPELPGALASGGFVVVALSLVGLLALRARPAGALECRVGVALLGALGLAGVALGYERHTVWLGLCCLGLTVVLCSRLGWFGIWLVLALGGGALVLAVVEYGQPPLVLLLGAAFGTYMFLGPLLGRFNRRMMRRQAASEERARLAREIHDVLAHTLSALSVQLEGARMLTEQRPGDPRALAALERAQRLVSAGMAETGRAVAALRGEVLPVPEALRRLAEDFERESGVPCQVEVEGAPRELSADVSLAIYRAAQEALTNVRKHADATEVTIRLRQVGARAELVVTDRGAGKPAMASSGYGLVGIQERTELLGGELEAGPTADGFRVRLSVPA